MLKNSKGRGRPPNIEEDYALLTEVHSIDDIPSVGIKILNTLGKGNIKIASAKNMFYLLKSLDQLAYSSMDRLSKQKFKLICQVADQIQNKGISAIEHDMDEDDLIDF
jgi:hypothetical protein